MYSFVLSDLRIGSANAIDQHEQTCEKKKKSIIHFSSHSQKISHDYEVSFAEYFRAVNNAIKSLIRRGAILKNNIYSSI